MSIEWGHVKELVFITPLPRSLEEMKECIMADATKGLG
jgi:hypothetical protein